jgi:hypothetical protein
MPGPFNCVFIQKKGIIISIRFSSDVAGNFISEFYFHKGILIFFSVQVHLGNNRIICEKRDEGSKRGGFYG